MNIRTLARDLNLSPGTVSICLTGKPEDCRISPETAARVRKYAGEVGYVPNHWARKIFKNDSDTVGLLICSDGALDKNVSPLNRIMSELSHRNIDYVVTIAKSGRWQDALNHFKSMKIKTVVFVGLFFDYPLPLPSSNERGIDCQSVRNAVADKTMKFYAVDYDFPGSNDYGKSNFYRFGSNRSEIYLQLCRDLAAAGKTPIVCDIECQVRHLKNAGFVAPDFEPFSGGLNTFDAGAELASAVKHLWETGKARTVLLHNDRRAIGLIRGLRALKVRIPEDIGVIGFSNLDFCDECPIPLTSIQLPLMENAKLFIDALCGNKKIPKSVKQPGKVIWRQSATLT